MTGAEKTYEMNWDCEYCGAKKLLGKTHRFCPECGAAQNPEKRYFPPEEEKVAVEDHQFVGADVHCPACKEPQSGAAKCCTNCGSLMSGGAAVAGQADQVVGPGGQIQPPMGAAGAMPEKKKSYTGCIIAIIAVVVIGCGLLIANCLMTKQAALEVTKLTWKREIPIERYDEFKESGSCKSMPKDAEELSRKKGKETCKTRKIDNKDGTFKEKKECKKAEDQCKYKVTKWKVARTLKEEGDADDDPKWPKVPKLSKKGKKKVGAEREGQRTETYIVHFKETKGDDTHTCGFSKKSKWKEFKKGSTWQGETGGLVGDLKCDKLKKK